MADNVELNAATGGATILTDDCTTGHAQIIKLAISTDGSAVLIPAEATNGLDVDVTRVIPGTAATALGKAEDGAHTTGDVGVMALAVRSNTAASTSGADGDYQPLITDTNGKLWVNAGGVTLTVDGSGVTQPVSGTVAVTNAGLTELAAAINASAQMDVNVAAGTLAVTNAGTFAVQATLAAGATAIAKAEDVASAGADVGVPAMAVQKATPANTAGTDGDYEFLQMSAGKLWVNASGETLTVASHAVTNAGTFATQSVVTNAGTFATQVDGAALTALQLIDDTVFTDDAAFTPGTSKLTVIGAQADMTLPDSVDEGDAGALRMTLQRALFVNLRDANGDEVAVGGGTQYTEDAAAAANPVGNALIVIREDGRAGSLTTADGDNVALRGNNLGELYVKHTDALTVNSHAVTNAGTFATQVDGAALTALQLIDNTIIADDAAFTPATTSVNMAGFQADETATDSVDEGDAGAARMTLDRKQIVTAQGHAAGGLTIFRSLDLDETEEEVKASAGTIYGMWVTNTATTTRWVKFYNATAANTTVGTTTPIITIGVPGNATDDIAGSFGPGGIGIAFGTALSVAATTGVADADTGAPGANDVIVNIFYA